MPTKLTVFYAWQSDTPLQYNKSLIETALLNAAKRINEDMNLGGAQVIIDSDTNGILGTPPVTETILSKITSADIFAPDLTFVATTSNGKRVPNPNVMIEWGYALKSLGFNAMMPVMNSHYGGPSELPFDMGHVRHPLQYTIDPGSAKDSERRAIREKLSQTFEGILRIYIKECAEHTRKEKPFSPHEASRPPAFFFKKDHPLVTYEPDDPPLTYKGSKGLYMRLYPIYGGQPRIGNTGAEALIHKLKPLGDLNNPLCKANEFGAIVFETNGVSIHALTQMFASGEIWGVSERPFRSGVPELLVAVNVEKLLTHTLQNYLLIVKNDMKLIPPFTLELGLAGLQDLRLHYPGIEGFPEGMHSRPFVADSFHRSYQLEGFDWSGWQNALQSFFEEVYDLVGLRRDEVMTAKIIAGHRLPALG